jgi:hypothetical protein
MMPQGNGLSPDRRAAIAAGLNWLIALLMFGVGIVYLASSEVMPYHRQILATPWDDLPPGCKLLILVFMKGTGWVGISTAVSLAILLSVPFRRREPWSRWAILAVGATAVVPMLAGALYLRLQTGASAPLWPHVILCASLGTSFWLTRDFKVANVPSHSDRA